MNLNRDDNKFLLTAVVVIIGLLLAAVSVFAEEVEVDVCANLEGMQTSAPEGWSAIGGGGDCYEVPDPVTIDLTPPGGEPVTIDVNPSVGGSSGGVQIDVNPVGSSDLLQGEFGDEVLQVSLPTKITNMEQLQAFLFVPEATKEEKIAAVNDYLIVLMQELIVALTAEIEALSQ
jgi:hypothetical protein